MNKIFFPLFPIFAAKVNNIYETAKDFKKKKFLLSVFSRNLFLCVWCPQVLFGLCLLGSGSLGGCSLFGLHLLSGSRCLGLGSS